MKFNVFLFVVFLVTVTTKMDIYLPQEAVNKYSNVPNKTIPYHIATFGFIPYGATYIAELVEGSSEQMCQLPEDTQQKKMKKKDPKEYKVMIIKRGHCKFTQKIYNAEKQGADLAIVYDYVERGAYIIMKNDGHGHLVNIPSVFIGGKQGKKLLQIKKQLNKTIFLRIQFDVTKSNTVNLTLWLDPNHRQSYIFLRDYYNNKYYEATKNIINLDLNFRVMRNCFYRSCTKNDCLDDQFRYCFVSQHNGDSKKKVHEGLKYLEQQMRSYFLLKILTKSYDPEIWWKYMIKFDDQNCFGQNDVQFCSKKVMRLLGINQNIISSIQIQIKTTKQNIKNKKQNIFKDFQINAYNSSILLFPQASINSRTYYGLFRANNIFQMICESFEDMPQSCTNLFKAKITVDQVDQTQGVWKIILLIILALVIGFLIALFVYTRIIKRQVNQQMSLEVNKIVQNYVALTESKSSMKE